MQMFEIRIPDSARSALTSGWSSKAKEPPKEPQKVEASANDFLSLKYLKNRPAALIQPLAPGISATGNAATSTKKKEVQLTSFDNLASRKKIRQGKKYLF